MNGYGPAPVCAITLTVTSFEEGPSTWAIKSFTAFPRAAVRRAVMKYRTSHAGRWMHDTPSRRCQAGAERDQPIDGEAPMGRYGYWVVDGDGHAVEPIEMWERYLDEPYRTVRPRLVTDNRGVFRVLVDGWMWTAPPGPGAGHPEGFPREGRRKLTGGQIVYGPPHAIVISAHLSAVEQEDTLRHEAAHAWVWRLEGPRAGHGRLFRRLSRALGAKDGGAPETAALRRFRERGARVVYRCEGCGRLFRRFRRFRGPRECLACHRAGRPARLRRLPT